MTKEEIMNLPAGRKMDAFIEQRIFGKKVEWVQDDITDPYPIVPEEYSYIVDHYSTDIGTAWGLLEKIEKEVTVKRYEVTAGYRYWCGINRTDETRFDEVIAWGDTAPLAICRAALLTTIDTEG